MTQLELIPCGYVPRMRARRAAYSIRRVLDNIEALDRAYERSEMRAAMEFEETEATAFELVAKSRPGYEKACRLLDLDGDEWFDTWERSLPSWRTETVDLSAWVDARV